MSDINITVNDEIVNIDIIDEPVLVNVVNSPGVPGAPGQGVPVGGTTGQVLAKSSATNYDTAWVNVTGGAWGTITGTLSNQTDLQNALNTKVPYTGATTNVNLGEYEIKAGQVTLDTSPTGTAAVGTTRWNDTLGSTETTLKGGSVILKNGVDLVARVVNKVSPNTTLTKAAYQAVRVSGAQGQRLAVAFAQANNDNNSADTIGLVTETIATNQEGFIITVGQLENINTTGSLQGETWADGDVLYLSPTTAGALTNIKPNATIGHIVVIGYVEYAHANNGKIYVKVMNGWELGELHDVYVPTPSNNDVLTYETSSGLWKSKSVGTALGYTPANAATTLTINGVTYDLSANRSWTVSGGISGSGASGQVAYWTGTSAQSGSNNLFWDATNGNLGIGTTVAPAANGKGLSIYATDFPRISMRNSFTTDTASAGMSFYMVNRNMFYDLQGANNHTWVSNATERMRIFGTGNILIQSGGTFTDSGERLQVTGTMKVTGKITANGSTTSVSGLEVGTLNFQYFAVNNAFIAENTFYNGSAFQRVNTGSASVFYFAGGGFQVGTLPSGSSGTTQANLNQRFFVTNEGKVSISDTISGGGNITQIASSVLQVDSTTKGFLPPRMTTTQKNAISSPAAGLVVYDTTLNKLCVYTTAWETITSA